MCPDEFDFITVTVDATIAEIYEYKNSVLGILENIQADYGDLKFEASEIYDKLADPNNMVLLKEVLTKMG